MRDSYDEHGTGDDAPSRRRLLVGLLELAYASEAMAGQAFEAALTHASLFEVPGSRDEFLTFVQAFVQPVVALDLGDVIADALVADVRFRLGRAAPEAPPTAADVALARTAGRPTQPCKPRGTPCVALVGTDGFARANLARALLRSELRVVVVARSEDVAEAATEAGRVDVAVVRGTDAAALKLVEALASRWPDIAVVVQSDDPASSATLRARGVGQVDVQPTATTTVALVECVRRCCFAARRTG
jgi:hypothetical protein